ncbi:MAG: 2Fe-2S iron-sulfur cluster-binding protein, partial [Candidatus Poribacteria bacterium]|nr:2Fe-2S iron-sulfur cluster-binding protein [Candidatus Poribacteria bacterium]
MSRKVHVQTQINRENVEFLCEPRQSMLEVLRNELDLTGAKEGCNNGNCGACTIIVEGRPVNSCCMLGVEAEGKEVQTIEGVATPEGLHPLQQKFL